MFNFKTSILAAGLLASIAATSAQADQVTFDTWVTNYDYSGNYILTVDNNDAGLLNFNLTVDPWNAESVGLFIDFGSFDLPGDPMLDPSVLNLSNVNPAGQVDLFWYDVASPNCGDGCSLATLADETQTLLNNYDSEWELIFRLGDEAFNGIQTFSFTINDMGLTLDDIKMAAVRSNQFCHDTNLLPDDLAACYYGNKAYSTQPEGGPSVDEPGTIALLALALGMVNFTRRKKA